MPINDYDGVIQQAAREWNVDPNLLRSVIQTESAGNPNARSGAGAVGLAQIMPDTAKGLGVTDRSDPVQSIFGGAKYLSQLLDHYGSATPAIAAYNAGPQRVDDYLAGKGDLPAETQNYVPTVQGHYQRFSAAQPQAQPQAQQAPDVQADIVADVPAKRTFGAMSDKDFLSATAGGKGEADSDFLARTGAVAAQAPAPSPPPSPNTTTPSGIAQNVAAGATDAGANILNTIADPFGNLIGKPLATGMVFAHDALAPYLGYQRFDDNTRNMLLGDNVPQIGTRAVQAAGNVLGVDPSAVPANSTAERLARAGTAGALSLAGAGPAAAVMGGAGAVGGDLAAQAVPPWAQPAAELAGNVLAGGAAAGALRGAGAMRGAINSFANAPYNALASDASIPAMTIRPNAEPVPAGAQATPAPEAEMSPGQVKANQVRAETDKLNESQPAGTPDTNGYVTGVLPTQAETAQDAAISRQQKQFESAHPDAFKAVQAANNEARQNYFNQITGTPQDLENAREARSEQAQNDLNATWANKTDADASPVVDLANEIKVGPEGKRPVVVKAINDVVNQLYDADGNLETDPELLYGARKHLNDLLSKEAQRENPTSVRAQANLITLRDTLDGVIENAAPGFGQYLQNFRDASRPIDAMETLQNYATGNKPYDAQGNMQLGRVQGMMKQIVANRAKDGANPYQSISDDQMAQLWNLRDDLRRQAVANQLAAAKGSDTAQNLSDMARHGVGLAATTAAHALAGHAFPVVGNVAVHYGREALNARAIRKNAQKAEKFARPGNPLRQLPSNENPLAP